jgi:hypothetical protein
LPEELAQLFAFGFLPLKIIKEKTKAMCCM